MKKVILSSCFLISAFILSAQKQTNTWFFGKGVGLDFNQNPVVPIRNSGLADSFEGLSCVSDNNGKIIFYTNGLNVVNKLDAIMKNGTGLAGDRSSTNNTVVVPLPGTANKGIYYIFTTGAALQETHDFRYSIVDMNREGGLGEVISKNIPIEDTVFEKIAAVRHCNNKDFWIIIHKWKTDEYHAYRVTGAGLDPTPVISHTGLVISGYENNEIGTLKFNIKGNKLVSVHSFLHDAVEMMDFDITTGIISNPILFKPNAAAPSASFPGVYGAEFSPDGKLLYVSANNTVTDASVLYQFDITSNVPATILTTKQIISVNSPWDAGSLQLGPDFKIYMAMKDDSALSVIEKPDIYGTGCDFRFNKIYMGPLSGQPVQSGLPTFSQSYFDTTANPYDFVRAGKCNDLSVNFTINRLSGIDSVKWNFGDGQQSQLIQPTNTYANPGLYDVSLIVYKVDCSGTYDTINRRIWVADNTDLLGKDTLSCNPVSLDLSVGLVEGASYLWNTGYTGINIKTSGYGKYWVEISQNGCILRDTVEVKRKDNPFVELGVDTTVCLFKSIILKTGNTVADSYTWSTGETTPTIKVDKIGSYYVTVKEADCVASDTVLVTAGDCDVYLPSAFTPNNDNLNEDFGVIGYVTVQYYLMRIYSKWGEMIFSSNDITNKWDGKFKGKNMPNGSYLWTLTYVNRSGRKFYEQGTVMLIR